MDLNYTSPQTTFPVADISVNRHNQSLNEWVPPENAVPFIHSSINLCDEMDTHNIFLDYDGIITGTPGITDHPLTDIDDCFKSWWQADNTVADDDQYLEIELSEAVWCDSHIFNMYKPQDYRNSPYTPSAKCWKGWVLKGKLLESDEWITLETVTTNTLKFYRGTFTRGEYRYFRLEGIHAYNDVGQTARVDAYLYTMGIYDSENKFNDTFPDTRRGRNDRNGTPEYLDFTDHDVFITGIDFTVSDVYCLNGEITKVIKGEQKRQYRHIGGVCMEFCGNSVLIDYPQSLKFTRLNSIDFVANSGICLYMFPPPNEIWWFMSSAYAFDETSANINTPVVIKIPDNSSKVVPVLTEIRSYDTYSVLGARYEKTTSGIFKANKYFVTFADPINMQSQIKFDGQDNEGLVTDMDGTALTGSVNANSNVNIARLKIGDIWRGKQSSVIFNPPIKLDGDILTDLFEIQKEDKVLGSVFRYALEGFKVPK